MNKKISGESDNYKYSIIIGIVAMSLVFVHNVSLKRWKDKQSEAVCYPNKKAHDYPLIAYLPHTSLEDPGKLFSFIEEYIHLTLDESMDGYEKTTATSEFKMDYVKSKLERAIYLSKDKARLHNEKLLIESNSLYYRLNQCKCGYHFNIDAIESVNSLPVSGTVYVTVLGSYQISYDKNATKIPNAKVYGYKRYHFVIGIGAKDKSTKGVVLNEYGYYVINVWDEDIQEAVRDDLFKNKMILGWDNLSANEIEDIFNKVKNKPEWGIE